MKLLQISVTSNEETVSLKNNLYMDTLQLKSIYFMNSVDFTETSCQVEISFLKESVNVHSSHNQDLVILPLNTEAGKRLSYKHYDILFKNVNVPQNFTVKILNANGTAFDNAKIGEVLISLESNSK